MGSSVSGPPNPNDQLFNEASSEIGSGPGIPPDGLAEDPEREILDELQEKTTGAAAGE